MHRDSSKRESVDETALACGVYKLSKLCWLCWSQQVYRTAAEEELLRDFCCNFSLHHNVGRVHRMVATARTATDCNRIP